MTATSLKQRMDLHAVDGDAYAPMIALEKHIRSGSLGEALLSLVRIRASQINGCAFCLDMHAREARAAGVSQRKIDVLAGWREAPDLYAEKERAAIALAEEVTAIGDHGVSDAVWNRAAAAFKPDEIARLVMAICSINVWNRIAITTHQALPAAPRE